MRWLWPRLVQRECRVCRGAAPVGYVVGGAPVTVEGTWEWFADGAAGVDGAEVVLVLIADVGNDLEGLLSGGAEGVGKLRRGVLGTVMGGCQGTGRGAALCVGKCLVKMGGQETGMFTDAPLARLFGDSLR